MRTEPSNTPPSEEVLAKMKEVTEGVVGAAGLRGYSVEVKTDPIDKTSLFVSVRSNDDVSFLIGRGGGLLNDLQVILNGVYRRLGAERFVLVDINDYRRDRMVYLKEMAQKLARKVNQTKETVVMEPMPFYERKAIHIELAALPDVITESEGKGEERHIVIRPYVF